MGLPGPQRGALVGRPQHLRFEFKHLPPSLRICLPPAMTAKLTDSFWDFDESVADVHPPWWAQLHSRIRPGLQGIELLNSRSANLSQLNARQLLNRLRNSETFDFSSLSASPCADSPPGEPNVFTDGAYKHPQTQRWGLGGFGAVSCRVWAALPTRTRSI